MIGALRAAAGQSVAAGTPLFDVVATDPLWVRVSVYIGDLAVVAGGPAPGALVVSSGTAELFGTEFGPGK